MKLQSILAACLVLGVLAVPTFGQDKADAAASKSGTKKLEALKEKQDNVQELNKFFSQEFRSAFTLMNSNKADEAEKVLNDLETVVKGLSPEKADAKNMVKQAQNVIGIYRKQLVVARVSIDDLKKKLAANAGDAESLNMLLQKSVNEWGTLSRSKPKQAEKAIGEFREYVKGLAAKVDDQKKKDAVLAVLKNRSIASIEGQITRQKKLLELVGKPATELKVNGWVNGSPLTDADLKGKVVLLDFWAIWCGPCIATFPHLREWNEKYDEKDFVIIGLTNYYKNYGWDDAAGRIKRAPKPLTADEENQMLVKFAEHHKLHHRFAIQNGRDLATYYGVSGIPHAVVIDREGIVRLVRVGSGAQNAKDISEMLEKLIKG